MDEEPRYMTIAEAAAALGLSHAGVLRRITRGDMRATKIGQRVHIIPVEEVERWRALGKLKPGPRPGRTRAEGEGMGKKKGEADSPEPPKPPATPAVPPVRASTRTRRRSAPPAGSPPPPTADAYATE
jgi:excisionase family DNA binding protein